MFHWRISENNDVKTSVFKKNYILEHFYKNLNKFVEVGGDEAKYRLCISPYNPKYTSLYQKFANDKNFHKLLFL